MLIVLLTAAALAAAPGDTRPAMAAPPNVNIPLWAPGQVPLAHHNQNLHVGVREQLETVVVNRAKKFAHAAHSARHNLLGDLFGAASPRAAGLGIPCDGDTLIRFQRAQIRLVHKRAHAHVPQIGHFGERVSHLHIVASAHRQ